MGEWLTLKEASKATGKSVPALRQAIKRGKLRAKKVSGLTGEKWVIDPDILGDTNKIEGVRLNTNKARNVKGLTSGGKQSEQIAQELYERLIEEKNRVNIEQGKHLGTLQKLLTDFQERIHVLKADNLKLEQQIKLLPAPPEEITTRLAEQEKALAGAQARLQQVESDKDKLKDTLQDTQNAFQMAEEKNKGVLLKLEEEKASRSELEGYKQQAEREAEVTKEELAKIQKKKEDLATRLKEEKESVLQAQAELEKEKEIKASLETVIKIERERPWWKKLFGVR